jgi:hypothetical protein
MKRLSTIALFVSLLGLAPSPALANDDWNAFWFPACGTVVNRNTSHQFGIFNWVEYIVETQGSFDICLQVIVIADADMPGVPNSGLHAQGFLYASARRQVPVPSYRTWQTNGHHFVLFAFPPGPPVTLHTGETASRAAVVPPPASDPAAECSAQGWDYYWNGGECVWTPGSPIIIDTAGDGYQLTSVEDGVRFDLDADGYPERVAWTRPGSDDAFLVMDRNGNGRIDDGSELFGNYTRIAAGSNATAANGFEALKFFESPLNGPVGRVDGVIDANDPAWSHLMLWRDLNHNGISEPEELQSVSAAGLAAIGTDYKTRKKVDRFGNEFRQLGHVTWTNGETSKIYDVWLQMRN